MTSYLNGDAVPSRNEDGTPRNVLTWWKVNAYKFPHVVQVAQSILGIPASSVPSERVFSKPGELLTVKRLKIKPEKVDLLLFLKDRKEEIKKLLVD